MIKGLIVVLTQGFANRLKMLASTQIYSKYILNLKLYICWNKAPECNIDYNRIFKNNHTHLFQLIKYTDVTKLKYHFFGRVHTASIFDKIDKVIQNPGIIEYIVLEGGHEFNHPKIGKRKFLYYKNIFYKSLNFSQNILDKVEQNLNNTILNNKYIAIHFRDFIKKYDGLDGGRSNKVHFNENSPYESFCYYINKLKIDIPIFILSNNPNIIKKFQKTFPDKKFYSTDINNFERDDINGIIGSILEFIIMSRSSLIIGSYFSSFSDEASFFKMIPKITPLNQKLIENLNETILSYHCLNYSFNEGIACLNYSENHLFKYFHADLI
jgi:hypothetical protein